MEHKKQEYNMTAFETHDFVNECLEAFDKNVSKVESEHAVTGKSA